MLLLSNMPLVVMRKKQKEDAGVVAGRQVISPIQQCCMNGAN